MKIANYFSLTILFSLLTFQFLAQGDQLMNKAPKAAEDYREMEQQFLNSMDWLEKSTVNREEEKRKQQLSFILTYCMGSPDITLTLDSRTADFNKKNAEFLVFFLGGWARYAINHEYQNNDVQGTLAGLKCVIERYKTGQYKKDKFVEKIIALDKEGKLEAWVQETIG